MGDKRDPAESADFLRNHGEVLAALFDECGEVCLFIKDARHRFVRCNRALLHIHGLEREDQMLGRTDHDFHPPMLADAYVAEDRAIMRSGKTVRDAAWLVTTEASSRWYACTKLPIRAPEAAATGGIIGVAGILVPYEGTGRLPMSYQRVEAALELARSGYAEGVRVSDLATAAGFSRNQFTRIFEELFHMTPGDYLLRMRVDHGRRLLSQTRKQITEIALESGFYDHSAFSKAFRRQTGMTPRDYRKRFAR